MSTRIDREPLDLSEFPSNLQKHVESDAPEKMKVMAAQGMVPAPPEQTVRLLYQLHFEESSTIREAIDSAVDEIPENPLLGAIEDEDREGVLDWIADVRGDTQSVVEELLRNEATPDQSVARLAGEADAETCEVIATNEVRILRSPQIIERLYQNPDVRMATVDQLIELADRNDVELDNLPGVQRALRAEEDVFDENQADESGVDDEEFAEVLEEEAEQAEREAEQLEKLQSDDLTRSEREELREEFEEDIEEGESEEDETENNRRITQHDLQQMSVAEKIRLATVGSRSVITQLVQDPNKLVHMAAIESPQIKTPDAVRFASQKSLPDDVISYIANNREWTQNYRVVKNLVQNPKTPVSDSLDLLKRLRNHDLKKLRSNRDVPHQVSRAAERLYEKRTGQNA